MSERSTFELAYTAPERIAETVAIDDTVSHLDILLLQNQEKWQDGMRWVNVVTKALRLSRIDERSLVISDLSGLTGDHEAIAPAADSELGQPFDVMDIFPDEPYLVGRDHNPARLPLLQNELVSRHHLTITPHLGRAGLSLTLLDSRSVNGSRLRVARSGQPADPAYSRLFA